MVMSGESPIFIAETSIEQVRTIELKQIPLPAIEKTFKVRTSIEAFYVSQDALITYTQI